MGDQAEVIQRMFTQFVGGASIVGLANSLNEEGIRTFTGKKWSPATIFHMLKNETYTGRTVYKRTKATVVRDQRTGQKHRRVQVRGPEEWIEIPDATPPIVDMETFWAAQSRLQDPERLRRGRRESSYSLSGRIRCIDCGKSMVGQTLQGKYRYYRCRRAFAGPRHDRCPSRYVRAGELEEAVRQEAGRVLSDPGIVLAELNRIQDQEKSEVNAREIQAQIDMLEKERERLAHLYQWGEIDEAYFKRESATLRTKNDALLERLRNAAQYHQGAPAPSMEDITAICGRVEEWIRHAEGDEMVLLTDALQLRVEASSDAAELSGVIPLYAPSCSDADVCAVVSRSQAKPDLNSIVARVGLSQS